MVWHGGVASHDTPSKERRKREKVLSIINVLNTKTWHIIGTTNYDIDNTFGHVDCSEILEFFTVFFFYFVSLKVFGENSKYLKYYVPLNILEVSNVLVIQSIYAKQRNMSFIIAFIHF